jgi:putative transcriptional regulator
MAVLVPTKWKLAEILARHKIKSVELAKELGISTNAMSGLKRADTMPRIDGDRLDELAAAITKLSKIGESIRGVDLLEDRDE